MERKPKGVQSSLVSSRSGTSGGGAGKHWPHGRPLARSRTRHVVTFEQDAQLRRVVLQHPQHERVEADVAVHVGDEAFARLDIWLEVSAHKGGEMNSWSPKGAEAGPAGRGQGKDGLSFLFS